MGFEVGIGCFENTLVFIVKVNQTLEVFVSFNVGLFDLVTIQDDFLNEYFSQVLEELKFFFLTDNFGCLIELFEPGLNTIVNNSFNRILQEFLQLFVTQPINVLEPFLNKRSQDN